MGLVYGVYVLIISGCLCEGVFVSVWDCDFGSFFVYKLIIEFVIKRELDVCFVH